MSGTEQNEAPHTKLFPKENWVRLQDNNYQLDYALFKCPDPVIPVILQGHYIWPALTKAAPVPEVYLQQFWSTMHTTSKKDRSKILATLHNRWLVLTVSPLDFDEKF
ncbi:unnamed protein product, partial [Cuscuta europaea]